MLLAAAVATVLMSQTTRADDETTPGNSSSSSSNTLETIFVTASPITNDPDDMATIAESVDRHQILQQGGATLADALGNAPGVTGTGFASGASRPVIRGFDAQRVRVLEDGISSFDVSDVGPDHGVPVDPLSAERIEVVRGAATLRYGSQAIGGVVNAINNRVPLELPAQPISGEVAASYGDNANASQGSALLDAGAGPFAFHVDGFARHTDDYDIPDGTMSNSYFKGNGYALGSSYFFGADDKSRIGVGGVHYDSQYGIPGEDTYIDMKQTKGMLRSSFAVDAGAFQKLDVEGGYGDYEHSEIDPTTGEVASTFKINEWDARAEGVLGEFGPFSGAAIGLQAGNKNFSALGEGADYLLPTATKNVAGFVFGETPLGERTRLQVGARVEQTSVDGTPASGEPVSRDFTPVSGSVGLLYEPSKQVSWGLTLSSAARAPGQTELFARGPHDGPGTFETGDPALDLERANSLEGSLRLRHDRWRLDTSLWGARFDNYIYGRLTGRTCDDEGVCVDDNSQDLKELIYTQVGAEFWGTEAKSTIAMLQGDRGTLNAELMADYVRAKTTDGDNLPRVPPYHIGAGISWVAEHLDAGAFARYTAEQDDVATGETPTAGFTSLDAHIGWSPWTNRPGLEIALVGRNLTDSTQRNAIALNKDEVILPGRDLRLTLNASF
jgi:iron complex outermembrane receptor protein